MSDIKWAPIIPLIGGFPLGAQAAIKSLPSMILSYSAFESNDAHLVNYYRKLGKDVPVILLDDTKESIDDLDLVLSTCPCAGVSTQSLKSDKDKNDWMYVSAEYVLGSIKPRVFIGENAPLLFTGGAEDVVERLKLLANEYGYKLSLYYTNAKLHGLPQNRQRTFYIFWKDDVYLLPFTNISSKTFEELMCDLLKKEVANPKLASNSLSSHFSVRFMKDLYGESWRNVINQNGSKTYTMWKWMMRESMVDDFIDWARDVEDDDALDFGEKAKAKGNVFDKTVIVCGTHSPALTAKNMTKIIHPFEDRSLNISECFALMGFPDNFTLSGKAKNLYHIAQNVPVNVAYHMTKGIISALNNELPKARKTNGIVMQDNIAKKNTFPQEENSTFTLF